MSSATTSDSTKKISPSEAHAAFVSAWDEVGPALSIADSNPQGPPTGLARFRIARADGAPFFDFVPGQYVWLLSTDEELSSAFSIVSAPAERQSLEFYVNGASSAHEDAPTSMTGLLFRERAGLELLCRGPEGGLSLDRTDTPDVFLVGAGTGIGPFVSMVRQAWHEHRNRVPLQRRLVLIHGASRSDHLGFHRELAELAAAPGFPLVYVPTVSRPTEDPDWTAELGRGRADDVLRLLLSQPHVGTVEPCLPAALQEIGIAERLRPNTSTVYLCGKPEMIASASGALAAAGFTLDGESPGVITEDY